MAEQEYDTLTLTAEIVSSFLGGQKNVKADEIPEIIRSVRAALSEDVSPAQTGEAETPKATKSQINKSVQPHGLTSFIDGKVYKTLKRHLARHGHSFDSYKAAYGLPSDYPSVAPDYSAARSAMAKTLGLGARGRGSKPVAAPTKATKKSKASAGQSAE